jgi:6-pyruvoyltetrahydropterin/6-carboxytetrahydropterin synthase
MYKIKKSFHLAYGHRLQDHDGKCANLHGHNAVVEVSLKAEQLGPGQMVMDFHVLGVRIKAWLDANLDHATILDKSDPLAEVLGKHGQRCFLTDTAPTAEVLARLIFEAAEKMGLPVAKVAFWETPTAMASYKK